MSRRTKRQSIVALAYDRRGRLICVGRNSYAQTHPVQANFAQRSGFPGRIYLHAEIDALIKARGRPIHRIVVSRRMASGRYGLAAPCETCSLALREFGVSKVEYTS